MGQLKLALVYGTICRCPPYQHVKIKTFESYIQNPTVVM
ncbi:hypothetical protein BGS_0293 [Beggiatoa sp. SS]|nr:hypothetical protein BGS_0293 [Beggiatoa sp. SS]